MYTVYIFITLAGLVALAGAVLFALATVIVAIRAGIEVVSDAAVSLARKVASAATHRPKVPAVNTVPTFRR